MTGQIGFIGLGNLGFHLAASLIKAGFSVTVHDLNRDTAAPLLAKGAQWADSPAALSARCESVLTCLPSPAAVTRVVTGE
ncbi:MAG TPA: NAD(P)-binding domain-containing protein, partial [Dongiaceae bacterium]